MSSEPSPVSAGPPSDSTPEEDGVRFAGVERALAASSLLLSAQPADTRSRTAAVAVVIFSITLFLALIPFSKVQLEAFPMFVPVYQAFLIVNELVTALLLFAQLRVTRSRALLVLCCAYVFSALMAAIHMLSFPGAFAPGGLLGGGPQTTAYLFVFWHTGFPLLVIAYALRKNRPEQRPLAAGSAAAAVAAVLVAVALLGTLATAGHDIFPAMLQELHYAPFFNAWRYGQWFATAAAAFVLWRVRPHSVLDLWLMIVLCAWFIEIGLVAIFNAGRYDLGFYAGRIYGLMASSFVLAVLLWEQSRMYSSLQAAHDMAVSEARLRASRDVMRLAMAGGRMGAWSTDLRADSVWWSAELEEIAGMAPGAFAGTREAGNAVIHPDDLPALRGAIKTALQGGQDFAIEFRLHHTTGEWRWMQARGRASVDGDHNPTTLFGICMDVTQQKRSEEAARQIEARFQTLADEMPQLAWMARPDGWIYWYNRRWYDYTGKTEKDMQGWGWQDVHDPAVLSSVLEKWKSSIETGQHFEMIFPLRDAQGRYRSFLTRVSPLKAADGSVLHWFGTNTDITSQREAEAALVEADRRKDEFLATLAHELRNPLAPIRNAAEVMARVNGLPAPVERMRVVIDRQSLHLSRLVDDLLEVSRINQGKIQLRKSSVSIVECLQDALEATRGALEQPGHEVAVSLPDNKLMTVGDATRITQIFINLLTNAGKFTPAGGRITVRAEHVDSQARITISDTGIGIAQEHLPGIFDIFSQVTPALERSQGGLGIGLALVRGFVALHDGSVQVRSEGQGRGTQFTVLLPLSAG